MGKPEVKSLQNKHWQKFKKNMSWNTVSWRKL